MAFGIAAARPPTTGAANPQMPGATSEDPGVRTSTKEKVTTQEIHLEEADDQLIIHYKCHNAPRAQADGLVLSV